MTAGRSRYCSVCKTHMPSELAGHSMANRWCPKCATPTTVSFLAPDSDWAERLQLPAGMSEAFAQGETPIDPVRPDDDSELGIISLPNVAVIEEGRYYWLDAQDVALARSYWLRPFDIVRVQGGELYEVSGRQESRRRYWVRPFSPTLSSDDLRKLSTS